MRKISSKYDWFFLCYKATCIHGCFFFESNIPKVNYLFPHQCFLSRISIYQCFILGFCIIYSKYCQEKRFLPNDTPTRFIFDIFSWEVGKQKVDSRTYLRKRSYAAQSVNPLVPTEKTNQSDTFRSPFSEKIVKNKRWPMGTINNFLGEPPGVASTRYILFLLKMTNIESWTQT